MTSPQIVPHSRKASRSCAATSVSEGGLDLRVVAITLCISAAVRETLAARRAMTRNYAAIKETGRGGRAGGIRNAPQLGHCGALKEGKHSLRGMRDNIPARQALRVFGTQPECLRLQLSSLEVSAESRRSFSRAPRRGTPAWHGVPPLCYNPPVPHDTGSRSTGETHLQ